MEGGFLGGVLGLPEGERGLLLELMEAARGARECEPLLKQIS
jgi:hypothetical protein